MPFSVRVLVATSINAQASLCQTIWPSTFKDLESSLLAGYNITCKALGISAIIKGSRGKRDSKGFKAVVNSLKTLPFSVGFIGRARRLKSTSCWFESNTETGWSKDPGPPWRVGKFPRPVVSVESTTTAQVR